MGCVSAKPAVSRPVLYSKLKGIVLNSTPMLPTLGDVLPAEEELETGESYQGANSDVPESSENSLEVVEESIPFDDLLSIPLSVEGCSVESVLAENASSCMESSSAGQPCTPGPVVSPNPGSPVISSNRGSREGGFFGILTRLGSNADASVPLPVVEEVCIPTAESEAPISANTTYLSTQSRPTYPSRLAEVADQKNLKLCMQILAFWRSGILKEKVDGLYMKLEKAGEASRVILSENDVLKNRVAELEKAIVLTNGRLEEKEAASKITTGTETIDLDTGGFLTPQQASIVTSGFLTPEQARSPVARSPAGFLTPEQDSKDRVTPSNNMQFFTPMKMASLPTLANLPREIFKSPHDEQNMRQVPIQTNWESYVRSSQTFQKQESPKTTAVPSTLISRSNSLSKEKLREISADLQRLADNLAAKQSCFSINKN